MEIAKLFGTLGFRFDPKGLKDFQRSLQNAQKDMVRFSNSIRQEVHKINAELASLRNKLNFSGSQIGGQNQFNSLRTAITQTKIALDSLHARSAVYAGAVDRINGKAAAGVPIWRAYRTEVQQVQKALQSLNGTLRTTASLSNINIVQRGGVGRGVGGRGVGGSIDERNNAMALMLGGLAGGGFFNTARTAIVAGISNAALFGTGALVKNVIDRGRELRASEQVLMANTKDMNEYKYLNDWLIKLSDRLGVNLIESQKAFGAIMMSARAGGGNLEQSQKVFTAFSEYATTMHLSQETQERLLKAVQQTYTIQKIHGQELNQFANAGLNMKALLVDAVKQAYGVDDKTARKMATSGQAETLKVMPFIAEALSKIVRNNDSLQRAMHSSQAEQGRFQNAFTRFSGNVMENGGDAALAKFFQLLTKIVDLTDKFYTNLVGLNELFSKISGGNSSWVWALNLFIILLMRGKISLGMFTKQGNKMLPMFWGVTNAVRKTHGWMGLLKAFMQSPFMRVIIAFGRKWLWIITVFQAVMTVGEAMDASMKGYTTWFDVWISKLYNLMIKFEIFKLRAYLAMRQVGIYMKMSQPDINPDGTPNKELGVGDKVGASAGVMWTALNYPKNLVTNAWKRMTDDDVPDPKQRAKDTATNIEASKQNLKDATVNLDINVKHPDGTTEQHKRTVNVNSQTRVGGN